jgi:50S ribosomal subunit-associated GTPase HflX
VPVTRLSFAASSPTIPSASRQYVNGAAALVYVVDASDEFQLGVSAASFHLLCSLPALRGKPVLLVWNKLDAPCPLPRAETTEAFELDRARAVLGEGGLTTMGASALSGLNVEAVMTWMRGVYES